MFGTHNNIDEKRCRIEHTLTVSFCLDFKVKPEGAPDSSPVGAGSSKNSITSQLQMSLDEARLILNVKKDDPMEVIQKVSRRAVLCCVVYGLFWGWGDRAFLHTCVSFDDCLNSVCVLERAKSVRGGREEASDQQKDQRR